MGCETTSKPSCCKCTSATLRRRAAAAAVRDGGACVTRSWGCEAPSLEPRCPMVGLPAHYHASQPRSAPLRPDVCPPDGTAHLQLSPALTGGHSFVRMLSIY